MFAAVLLGAQITAAAHQIGLGHISELLDLGHRTAEAVSGLDVEGDRTADG